MAYFSNLVWLKKHWNILQFSKKVLPFEFVSFALQKHSILHPGRLQFGFCNQIRIALRPPEKYISLTLYSKALLYKMIYIWQKRHGSD